MKFVELLANRDYTVATFAEDVGCTRAYIYQMLNGIRDPELMSYKNVVKMSQLLGEFPETKVHQEYRVYQIQQSRAGNQEFHTRTYLCKKFS